MNIFAHTALTMVLGIFFGFLMFHKPTHEPVRLDCQYGYVTKNGDLTYDVRGNPVPCRPEDY